MEQNATNPTIVACCGLVCTQCGAHRKGKCQGCHSERPLFSSCPVKKCVTQHTFSTCAECGDFPDLKECRKLNNFISKVFGFIFGKNRIGHLDRIRDVGLDRFKSEKA